MDDTDGRPTSDEPASTPHGAISDFELAAYRSAARRVALRILFVEHLRTAPEHCGPSAAARQAQAHLAPYVACVIRDASSRDRAARLAASEIKNAEFYGRLAKPKLSLEKVSELTRTMLRRNWGQVEAMVRTVFEVRAAGAPADVLEDLVAMPDEPAREPDASA